MTERGVLLRIFSSSAMCRPRSIPVGTESLGFIALWSLLCEAASTQMMRTSTICFAERARRDDFLSTMPGAPRSLQNRLT